MGLHRAKQEAQARLARRCTCPVEYIPAASLSQHDSTPELPSGDETTYHIYHTGRRTRNYSIHHVPDKRLPLPQLDDPQAPHYLDDPALSHKRPFKLWRSKKGSSGKDSNLNSNANRVRRMKRCHVIEDPKYDARIETSPYFVHVPHVAFHHPPYTLRRGGSKTAPVVCLLRRRRPWRHYDIIFADELARDGVVDGRGVVGPPYGVREKGSLIKGYPLRSWRLPVESGKRCSKTQSNRGMLDGDRPMEPRSSAEKSESSELSSPQQVLPSSPSRQSTDVTRVGSGVSGDMSNPIVPEEVVRLSRSAPWSREYTFSYRGIRFFWKGTKTVKDKKRMGIFLRYSNLKLVAEIPSSMRDDTTKGTPATLTLADYTCLMARRKSGRLTFRGDNVNKLEEILQSSRLLPDDDVGSLVKRNDDGSRVADLLMGTAMCMVIAEEQKRELMTEVIKLLIDLVVEAANG
ncbi:MAG: hypothetical protein M1817_004355 [Caeruleum heppii]|nr:MAG: hypothetical protein M1817_004355 [Caeruleum heppii]